MTGWSYRVCAPGAAVVAMGLTVGVLVAVPVHAGLTTASADLLRTGVDVAVGLAFVCAGVVARVRSSQRALITGVGIAWLVGSSWSSARTLHLAVLLVALCAFPEGRIRGLRAGVVAGAVALLAGQALPQIGVTLLLLVAAVVLGLPSVRLPAAGSFPAAAAAAVAAAVLLSWSVGSFGFGGVGREAALLVYETTLALVAVSFVVAARGVGRAGVQLTDEILSSQHLVGLDGLTAVLRPVLDDPTLQVHRLPHDPPISTGPHDRQLLVDDERGAAVAAVVQRCAALDDPPTAAAVAAAVRLIVTDLRPARPRMVRRPPRALAHRPHRPDQPAREVSDRATRGRPPARAGRPPSRQGPRSPPARPRRRPGAPHCGAWPR